uniref:ribonuclease H n=1 Tax=Eptatretus burgeri TaxID=7764 RepID=A0A8C4WTX5_EPTBU
MAEALIDTGSSENFVNSSRAKGRKWKIHPRDNTVCMASTSLQSSVRGYCNVELDVKGYTYRDVRVLVLRDLCADVILGHNVLKQHTSVEIPFGGNKPRLILNALTTAEVSSPLLFANLSLDCKPIAIKSRRYTTADMNFITSETKRLLEEGIIEPSDSPWRAQVLVTTNQNHKKRMGVDYFQTVNRFTHLDAYPLPRIDEMVERVANYKIFSTIDMRSAYHQIPIREEDKPYTAFEAGRRLYQFRRIPFGVTNGVACFQRVMDDIISDENLKDTFVYVDNVMVCGKDRGGGGT